MSGTRLCWKSFGPRLASEVADSSGSRSGLLRATAELFTLKSRLGAAPEETWTFPRGNPKVSNPRNPSLAAPGRDFPGDYERCLSRCGGDSTMFPRSNPKI